MFTGMLGRCASKFTIVLFSGAWLYPFLSIFRLCVYILHAQATSDDFATSTCTFKFCSLTIATAPEVELTQL